MTVQEIKKEKQARTDKLITDCKVFFAFSNEQFAKNKTELKEGEKYVAIGAGGYIPKSYFKPFSDGLDAINKWGKEQTKSRKLQEEEILYELQNHECFYTGDTEDVVNLFKGTYTKEKINKVYWKNFEAQTANL